MRESWLAPVLLLLLSSSAFADVMRCGDKVVSTDDLKSQVLAKCGEPAARESRFEEILDSTDPDRKRFIRIPIEDWTYDQGPQSLIRVLTFRNGKLSEIRTGGYGN